MSAPRPSRDRRWLIAWLAAIGLLLAGTLLQDARRRHVTAIPHWSVAAPAIDPTSSTGYAEGRRPSVSPGREQETYGWIARAQQAVVTGNLRPARIDWDNAPAGRADHAPALYTLWILVVAWVTHAWSPLPLAAAVEGTAAWSDPAAGLCFLVVAGAWTWRRFSARAAGVMALGWSLLQPLASGYLPGALDPRGLAWAFLTGGLLALASALSDPPGRPVGRRGFAAGVLLSLAAALDPASGVPTLLAVGIGAAAALARTVCATPPESLLPPAFWRAWGAGGVVGTLAAALASSALPGLGAVPIGQPGLSTIILWVALGESLAQVARLARTASPGTWCVTAARGGSIALALGAGATLVWLCRDTGGAILSGDPLATRLSPGSGIAADSLWAWLRHDGVAPHGLATLAMLGAGLAAAATSLRRAGLRMLPLLLPALLLVLLGSLHLRLLAPAGAALLVIAVLVLESARRRWGLALGLAVLLPGAILARPPLAAAERRQLTQTDVEAVVERDLAAWLARRSGDPGAVVLAAPKVSASLAHHAPLRAVASLAWENEEGLRAAVRIARSSSPEEAQALLEQRAVRYLVLASWDPFLDDAASASPGAPPAAQSFIGALRRWVPLRWLRPIPYRLPRIGGFEDQTVVVLEVVDEQTEPRTLSLQAEYFLETGRTRLAEGVVPELNRFPADLGARIALARVAAATGDAAAIRGTLGPLLAALDAGADRSLAWDRRVALASLLEQAGQSERALVQLQRAVRDATPERLRALTTGGLARWLDQAARARLLKDDSALWREGLRLLPPDLASRLPGGSTP
jgi:hypothetical protein